MASRVTIKVVRRGGKKFQVSGFDSKGQRTSRTLSTYGEAVEQAKKYAREEMARGTVDVEIHDDDGKVYSPSEFARSLERFEQAARTKVKKRVVGKRVGSTNSVFNVIFTFNQREQEFDNVPINSSNATSDANLLLQLLKSLKPAERADLVKISIAQHGPGPTIPWLIGASGPRQFFFGKEYRSRAPKKRGIFERLFS